MKTPRAPFSHILRMTDDVGMFEHARRDTPNRAHGYCVDDVARALLVVARQPSPSPELLAAARTYLDFVAASQTPNGLVRNRLGVDRQWKDAPSASDCWGRALWGLGTAAARLDEPELRDLAAARFDRSAAVRPVFVRSLAFAALGAAEMLSVHPDHAGARAILEAVPERIGGPTGHPTWPWPESRLTYANAILPEALLATGELLNDTRALDDGLELLTWLVKTETRDGHISVTPAGGWGPRERRPAFDQQPIEVAALADACVRAHRVTRDSSWLRIVDLAAGWFLGDNDTGVALHDPATGGGCDGLQRVGRNENQGAESTLAMVACFQHVAVGVRR